MKYQKLLSLTRQAVDTYQMINEGEPHRSRHFRRKRQPDASVCTLWPETLLSEIV